MKILSLIALILAILFGAYSVWAITNMQQDIVELNTRLGEFEDEMRTLHLPLEDGQLTLFFIRSTETEFQLVPVTRWVSNPPSPLLALTLLINGPLPQEDLLPSVPGQTQVRSLTISEGIATADFSKELRTEFVGGAQLESHLVRALVATLTQFDFIHQVHILLNGEMVESIAGHISIDHLLE